MSFGHTEHVKCGKSQHKGPSNIFYEEFQRASPDEGDRVKRRRGQAFVRYSSMATSMGVTIGLGVWLGMKLDEYWSLETPWATITGALLGVTIATYRVIQSLTKL